VLEQLPIHLSALALARAWIGDFAGAAALVAETDSVAAATGNRFPPYMALKALGIVRQGRRGLRGDNERDRAGRCRRTGDGATTAYWAAAVLYNGLGRYEEAAAAARQATS